MSAPDRTVQEHIFDVGLRIDRIFNLAHQCGADPVPDDVVEWFEDNANDALAETLKIDPSWVDEHGWDVVLDEEGGWLTGWILSVAIPRLEPSEDGKSARVLGWSSLLNVVHADTYDEAVEKALAWADAERERMWPRAEAVPS